MQLWYLTLSLAALSASRQTTCTTARTRRHLARASANRQTAAAAHDTTPHTIVDASDTPTPAAAVAAAAAALPPPPPQPQQQQQLAAATLALYTAALIFGSQHSVVKSLVEAVDMPAIVNGARFALAASLSAPWWPGAPWRRGKGGDSAETWRAGAELGGWMWLGFALQSIGLHETSASRSAFLLYLNVKLVPLLSLALYGRQSSTATWVSAGLALAGTTLISYDGAPPNVGDAFSLAAAAASALFILRLEAASSPQRGLVGAELNAATLASCAALCALWAGAELVRAEPSRASAAVSNLAGHPLELLHLAAVVTFVANWLQTFGQARIPAPQAAIIFSLDPVIGAAFAWALLGETLGAQGALGVGLVLSGIYVSSRDSTGKAEPD